MKLSYRELRKRDVINIEDGRCLGRIIDLDLKFPEGVLIGIVVPGRRVRGIRIFDRSEVYIDQRRIIKIGGDVILVNVNCGDTCLPSSTINKKNNHKNPKPPCSPPCPPACPPSPCPPPCHSGNYNMNSFPSCEQLMSDSDPLEDEY